VVKIVSGALSFESRLRNVLVVFDCQNPNSLTFVKRKPPEIMARDKMLALLFRTHRFTGREAPGTKFYQLTIAKIEREFSVVAWSAQKLSSRTIFMSPPISAVVVCPEVYKLAWSQSEQLFHVPNAGLLYPVQTAPIRIRQRPMPLLGFVYNAGFWFSVFGFLYS
jgi:hypothetical protein